MNNFDEIKPKYVICENNKDLIKKIDSILEKLSIPSDTKKKHLFIKSNVRSLYSSFAIEANSLSLDEVSKVIDNKLVLASRTDIQEVKNANEL